MSMEDAINNLASAINNLAATRQPQVVTITSQADDAKATPVRGTTTAEAARNQAALESERKAAQKAVMAAVEADRKPVEKSAEMDAAVDKVIAAASGPIDYKKDALPVLTLLVKKDAPAMRKILDSYGVQKASELAPDDLAAVVAQVNELLAA